MCPPSVMQAAFSSLSVRHRLIALNSKFKGHLYFVLFLFFFLLIGIMVSIQMSSLYNFLYSVHVKKRGTGL